MHVLVSMSEPLPIKKEEVSMHEMNILCKIENQEAVSKGVWSSWKSNIGIILISISHICFTKENQFVENWQKFLYF